MLGNVMLKKSTEFLASTPIGIYLNWYFLAGLAFYGINVLLFSRALVHLPVSAAYPVLAGVSFLSLALAGLAYLNEPISKTNFVGMVAILVGIYLLTRGTE